MITVLIPDKLKNKIINKQMLKIKTEYKLKYTVTYSEIYKNYYSVNVKIIPEYTIWYVIKLPGNITINKIYKTDNLIRALRKINKINNTGSQITEDRLLKLFINTRLFDLYIQGLVLLKNKIKEKFLIDKLDKNYNKIQLHSEDIVIPGKIVIDFKVKLNGYFSKKYIERKLQQVMNEYDVDFIDIFLNLELIDKYLKCEYLKLDEK